jgi:hypothetical protein
MAPARALPPTKPKTTAEKLQAWLKDEYCNDVKFSSNLVCSTQAGSLELINCLEQTCIQVGIYVLKRSCSDCSVILQALLRAVGLFSASVFVIVNFGDAFSV